LVPWSLPDSLQNEAVNLVIVAVEEEEVTLDSCAEKNHKKSPALFCWATTSHRRHGNDKAALSHYY
jgi:hypothetical protein